MGNILWSGLYGKVFKENIVIIAKFKNTPIVVPNNKLLIKSKYELFKKIRKDITVIGTIRWDKDPIICILFLIKYELKKKIKELGIIKKTIELK